MSKTLSVMHKKQIETCKLNPLDDTYDLVNRVNIGSGNGVLSYGTKLLTEPVLTYHQKCFVAFT